MTTQTAKFTLPKERLERVHGRSVCGWAIALGVLLSLLCVEVAVGDEKDAPAAAPSGLFQTIKDSGVVPFLFYYGEEFAVVSGGAGHGQNYDGLLKFGLNLDLEKLVHGNGWKWSGGSACVSVLYPHGLGVTNQYAHDFNVLSNIDAYDSWRLFEAWVQQDLLDHRLFIRAGQLTTDSNFFVSDSAALYINSAFGTIGTVTHNIVSPIYPVASPGVMVKFSPNPSWYFQGMVVDDNIGAQDTVNKHGCRFNFHDTGVLAFYELGFQRKGPEEQPIKEGKFELGGFYDSGTFQDNQRDFSHHGDYAFYAVADQQLYREKLKPKETFRGLSAFGRVSLAPEDRNPVTFYFDTGLNYTGLLPGRNTDIVGIAFSYEHLSNELRASDGGPLPSHHEHVIEVTYQWTLNDHCQIQPDLQYIINPGAVGTTPNALAVGLRVTLSF